MDQVRRLSVAEAFASIQGEGRTMGVPSIFIRLAGCNLMCGGKGTEKDGLLHNGATWRCDSIEVWRKGKMYNPEELVKKLDGEFEFLNKLKKGYHLIITGGEPMMQQPGIIALRQHLASQYRIFPFIEIETNGTIAPTQEFHMGINQQYNVSPKLANSGEPVEERFMRNTFVVLNSQFKYVVSTQEDVAEVSHWIKEFKIPTRQVWLMPAAITREELDKISAFVVSEAMKLGANYSHRLHIDIWNQKTGV